MFSHHTSDTMHRTAMSNTLLYHYTTIMYLRNKRKRTLEGGLDAAESNDFTSVTETNARRPGAPRSRKVKAKKDTELKNFYRFQIKEQKVQELDSLRKKFAEDKERVAKMKEQRKFKPF